jgi:hypothetical protein
MCAGCGFDGEISPPQQTKPYKKLSENSGRYNGFFGKKGRSAFHSPAMLRLNAPDELLQQSLKFLPSQLSAAETEQMSCGHLTVHSLNANALRMAD